MIEKYKLFKTVYNNKEYWLLYITKTSGTDLYKFKSKKEAHEKLRNIFFKNR